MPTPPAPDFAALARALGAVLPSNRLISDRLRTLAYGTDASFYRLVPKLVAVVTSEAELLGVMAACRAAGAPMTFRAAGTSLSGQAVSDSVLVMLGDGWTGSVIREDGAAISLQPGVIGAEANRRLAPHGRKIGPDPASIEAAMIGGIAANNSSGMCCGTARNSYNTLRSMRLVLVDGTVLDTGDALSRQAFARRHGGLLERLASLGAAVRADGELAARIRRKYAIKNTTGYALNAFVDFEEPFEILQHLMIGSEGTLGFIAEVTLETVPDPKHKAATLLFFDRLTDACEAVIRLKREPVDAAELVDRRGLASVTGKPGMPDFLSELGPDATALLVETAATDAEALAARVAAVTAALTETPPARPFAFTTDASTIAKYWKVRKGLLPAVGAVRPVGTTVLIEDVAVPIEHLASATADLQGLLARHGYDEAILFGHAFDGNLHFVFAQGFDDPAEVERYAALMEGVAEIVVGRYDGSLKAEHGTGRNMAPFVEIEWGRQATELMRTVKALFDPEGLLNPGVILNDDPKAHLKDLKPIPAAHPLVDACMECGFCEPKCPTRGLTLTPRQRIVGAREIARARGAGEPGEAFARAYADLGVDSCAVCGLCETACPVGINTGSLTKALRAEARGGGAERIARFAADHFEAVETGVRLGLKASSAAQSVLGARFGDAVGRGLRAASGGRMPLWNRHVPQASGGLKRRSGAGGGRPKVVYFASCATRTFGADPTDLFGAPTPETILRLLDKAGFEVITAAKPDALCCGQPWDSKGFPAIATAKAEEAIAALHAVCEGGAIPVHSDTSPCSKRLIDAAGGRVAVHDVAAFLHDAVLPRLSIPAKRKGPVALHLTCSTRRMGLDDKLLALARACADEVVVPPDIGCCGFSGDKGFTRPETNAHALRTLGPTLKQAGAREGFSTSRTCEIGLALHGGVPYRSIADLLDQVSKPLGSTALPAAAE